MLLDTIFWKNYTKVLGDDTLRRYMINSIVISWGNAIW